VEVTDGTVESAASQYPVFVLDCWAEWCGPCRMIAPVIEELAREMRGRVVFGKLNVDSNMQTANRYRISAIPTLLIFKNGKLVDKLVGAYPKASLLAKIQKHL
ncbi:MAG: thioredoxin, partial [Methanothrix sp.]|nr:thioredoxin [Methanothrix sp.]